MPDPDRGASNTLSSRRMGKVLERARPPGWFGKGRPAARVGPCHSGWTGDPRLVQADDARSDSVMDSGAGVGGGVDPMPTGKVHVSLGGTCTISPRLAIRPGDSAIHPGDSAIHPGKHALCPRCFRAWRTDR